MLKIKVISSILFFLLLAACVNSSDNPNGGGNPEIPEIDMSFDLNQDGIPDFKFRYDTIQTMDEPSSVAVKKLVLQPLNKSAVCINDQLQNVPFDKDIIIDASLNWSKYGTQLAHINWHLGVGWDQEWSGAWAGVDHKYIPLRITLLEKDFFGWAEISISSEDGSYTLHSFTYNSVAGEGVKTGVLY